MILAGDVGGTKTLLGLFEPAKGKLRLVEQASFPSRDHPSLEAIVRAFLGPRESRVRAFAVGVAGPVVGGRSHVVNLRWPVDTRKLTRALGLPRVRVLNDLEATAWGIPALAPRQLISLTPGLRGRGGNGALIAAGTGLGMALLLWDGERFHPGASEGGHQDFAPRDDLEIELLRYLRAKHGRVSTERIVAGPGFSAIYQFLVDTARCKESARMARRIAEADDANAAISAAGVSGEDRAAERTVDLFVSLFGSAAGNLALVTKATAGVWVGGGIAPKILPKLRSGAFMQSFRSKGRLSSLVDKVPVRVIVEPRTALLGAAACAARLASISKPTSPRSRRRSAR